MLKSRVEDFERRLIVLALHRAHWRQRQAARDLGVLPTTLNEKMKRLGIPPRPPADEDGPQAGETAASATEEFRWSGRLAVGRTLEIVGINGHLRAEAAPVEEVSIVASATGPASRRREVSIRVLSTRTGMRLVAEAAGGGTPDPDVQVDAWVRAPLGVRLVGRVGSGHLETFGVPGRFELRATDGPPETVVPFAHAAVHELAGRGFASSGRPQDDSGNGMAGSNVKRRI